jgi:hypothetical protein
MLPAHESVGFVGWHGHRLAAGAVSGMAASAAAAIACLFIIPKLLGQMRLMAPARRRLCADPSART